MTWEGLPWRTPGLAEGSGRMKDEDESRESATAAKEIAMIDIEYPL